MPDGIKKVTLPKRAAPGDRLADSFLQYLVNLKADRSFAKDEGLSSEVAEIDFWFQRFERRLQDLFQTPSLRLQFDRKRYTFEIAVDGYSPFGLNALSDGYSSLLNIFTELMLRMEAHGQRAYNQEGIVLIDEIETHLHIDLQKKILPFLIDFFPNIQFIVSTHSPFVISSVSNAVVCDLEKRIVIKDDLTKYSYDAIVESYFGSDKYSEELKGKVQRLQTLSKKVEKSPEERSEETLLMTELQNAPKFRAPEFEAVMQQIKLQHLKGSA